MGHIAPRCGITQLLQRARADATGGEIDHPGERGVVVGIGDQAQVSQRVLDLGALKKTQAAIDLVGNAVGEQHLLDHAALRVGPVKQRNLAALRAVGDQ